MIFVVFTVIGFALLPLLSLQFLPDYTAPSLRIDYQWQHASPELIEREVSAPLEGAFNLIRGIKKIASVSSKSKGYIVLEVDKKVDLDYLRFEVATKIRQLYANFPEGVSYPQISVHSPDEQSEKRPLIGFTLSGNRSPVELYAYAQERLSPQLSLVAGIRDIQITGGNQEEWQLQYQPNLLQAVGISKTFVLNKIKQHFQVAAFGAAKDGEHTFSIYLDNNLAKEIPLRQQLETLPLTTELRLKDIAKVVKTEQAPRYYHRINGQTTLRLRVFPNKGVNHLQVAEKILEKTKEIASQLPTGIQLHVEENATDYLKIELDKILWRSALSILILLAFVLLFYQNWRFLTVLLLSLIANLGLAFIFYYIFEVTLHLYALAGLTVSFGLMVDNTIIMAHHLHRQGNLKVFPALLASTLTTISALSMIFFLPEIWQNNLLDFAKVIMINLGTSLIVAVGLIPVLTHRFLIKNKKPSTIFIKKWRLFAKLRQHYQASLLLLLRFRKSIIVLTILAFGLPVFMLPNHINDWDWYNQTLGNDWYVEHIKPTVNKVLGGTSRLFSYYVYDNAAYQNPEETVLWIQASMSPGHTLEQLNRVLQHVEQYLGQFDQELKQYITTIQSGQYGFIQVYFKPNFDLHFPYQLKSRMIAYSINWGNVEWKIFGVGKGFTNENNSLPPAYQVRMRGYNKAELNRQASLFAKKLKAHPRVQEVNTDANVNWWEKDNFQYVLHPNRQKLAEQNLSIFSLMSIMSDYNHATFPDFYTPSRQAIRLVNQNLSDYNTWQLKNQIQSPDSSQFSFQDISQFKKEKTSNAIYKENQQYIQMVSYEYQGVRHFGTKHLEKNMAQMQLELPLGYSMERKTYDWNKAKTRQYGLLLLVVGLIFFICSIQFESLRQAFMIILLIPTSFIGIFLTFYLFDFRFDQGGYTSFVLLSGLVVNSLILILNDYNFYRKQCPNRSILAVYLKAFYQKITPIFLTIVSTSVGLIPFLTYGQGDVFWFALAVGTIGGLVFSLFLILFLIPVFFIKLLP